MGTPSFAETALRAIADRYPDEVIAVVTRQDTPKNRGHQMTPPPVKIAAEELGIPVFQPANLKEENFADTLQTLAPDIIVVAAYGRLLPRYVLDAPRFGCINIHGSLLPKYRGAAPIQRAILAGEPEMGVTIMKMEEGLDTGDMFAKASVSLCGDESFGEIHDKLAALGASLVMQVMDTIFAGTAHAEKQDDALSTYAAKIEKDDRMLDFSASAEEVHNRVRALSPMPGAEAVLHGERIKILRTKRTDEPSDGIPGTISMLSAKADGSLSVNCGDNKLLIERLVPIGKKEMSVGDFIRGHRITTDDKFE